MDLAITKTPTPIIPPKPATRTVNRFIGILTIGNRFTTKRNIIPRIILKIIVIPALPNLRSILIPNNPKTIINVPITINVIISRISIINTPLVF